MLRKDRPLLPDLPSVPQTRYVAVAVTVIVMSITVVTAVVISSFLLRSRPLSSTTCYTILTVCICSFSAFHQSPETPTHLCVRTTGAPCLPLICCGPSIECDGCAILKVQLQAFCLAITAAIPCDEEVPPALAIAGLTLYPKCGCCMPIKEAIERD
mmetsp:Transcript_18168/g.50433  ORF Transcript_18168/g.50433 Transcript_18168/m.50433 type:complete len:156 (+) Transcript_18168:347-814(+)